jgi:hypothetical protein
VVWPFRRKSQNVNEPTGRPRGMQVVTVLSPQQQIDVGGIPAEAIAGVIDAPIESGRPIPVTAFKANPTFVAFMQNVIRTLAADQLDLQEAARQQGSGSIGIIDLRTPEGVDGNVPLEDIVGIFAVADGKLGEYYPNDKYVVFTKHGLVRLPPTLRELHVRELMRLKVPSNGPVRADT